MGPFVAGVVAGYGIAVPVGAIGAYVVALGARSGLRAAGPAALGVASADGLFALLAVAGGAGLAAALADVAQPLRWVAFVVLLGIAVRIAAAGLRGQEPREYDVPSGRTYAVMLGATLLNPATVVYFAALVVAGGGAVGGSPASGGLFVAGAFLASASWQLLLAAGGSALGRAVTSPAGRRGLALLSAALVAGLAVGTVV